MVSALFHFSWVKISIYLENLYILENLERLDISDGLNPDTPSFVRSFRWRPLCLDRRSAASRLLIW